RGGVGAAVRNLRQRGRGGSGGLPALGGTPSLPRAIEWGVLDPAQVWFNWLNPGAGFPVPVGFPAQDFGGLLGRARQNNVGVIVIRALAGGALSGVETRHPVAVPSVDPIATAPGYRTRLARAQLVGALLRAGPAADLIEATIRLAVGSDAVSTVLVGYSSVEHLETAAAAVNRGPLPQPALDRLASLWSGLAGR